MDETEGNKNAVWGGKKELISNDRIQSKLAAAAAKSLQSCLTLCDPIDGSPPVSAVPGILQARTLEWVAISPLQIDQPSGPDLVKYPLNGHLFPKKILVFHLELISPILSFPITAHVPIYHSTPWLWIWVVNMSGTIVI